MQKIFFLSLLIICLLIFCPALSMGAEDGEIDEHQPAEPLLTLYLNGQAYSLESPLYSRDGIVYGPFREIFTLLGAEPSYISRHGRLLIWTELNENLSLQFEVETDVFFINHTVAALPAPTFLANGTLYIPLRFILELCGYRLHWVNNGQGSVQVHLLDPVVPEDELPQPVIHDSAVSLSSEFAGKARSVPVFMYHHLLPHGEHDGSNGSIISVEDFEQQMAYLFSNGYHTIGLADLYLFVLGQKSLPERSVVITFDDGYRSNYDYAFPILQQYRLRAVQFPLTFYTDNCYSWLPHMSWEQMEEASSVFEYHSHSHNLHYYEEGKPVLLVASEERLREDLLKSRELLDCFAFSYPFGVSSPKAVQILKETGYKMAFTIRRGNVHPGDDPFLLRRRGVYPTTTLSDFSAMLKTAR